MLQTIALAIAFVWGYLALGASEPDYLANVTEPVYPVYDELPTATEEAPAGNGSTPRPAPVAVTTTVVWADSRRQPQPPAATTTTTTLPGIMHHCPQWEAEAIAQGWPLDQLDRLDHVIWRESRCLPDAHNGADPTRYGSRGLTQINGFWVYRLELDADRLYEPAYNLRVALLAYSASGWSPWGYTD